MDMKEHFGTETTLAKQRTFSTRMKAIVAKGNLSQGEIQAFISAAMDYMMSYAADAYDRGLQTGMELGYAHGLEEATGTGSWEEGVRVLH